MNIKCSEMCKTAKNAFGKYEYCRFIFKEEVFGIINLPFSAAVGHGKAKTRTQSGRFVTAGVKIRKLR
jgi:hypothetical protein